MTFEERAKERKLLREAEEEAMKMTENFKPFYSNPIEPTHLKIVCDSMLNGLCKKLRLHGVDSVVIENFEAFENCATIAKKDKRMVLTKDSRHYIKLRQLVAKGTCLNLRTDKPEDQVRF